MKNQNREPRAKCVEVDRMFAVLRSCVCLFLLVFICGPAFGQERVWSERAAGKVIWHIEQPEVRQPITVYRQIRIRASDVVTIDAGGCVQTGGIGDTWKRYLDPLGGDGTLYHGMIQVGTARNVEMVPIQSVLGRRLRHGTFMPGEEPACPVCPVALVLGYSDDNYSDNGYYEHDDGTHDQCRGVGPAWVTVTIEQGYQSYENSLFSVQYRLGDHIEGILRNKTDRPLPCASFDFTPYADGRGFNETSGFNETNLQPHESRPFSSPKAFYYTENPEAILLTDVKHYCEGHAAADSPYSFYREDGFNRPGGDFAHFPLPEPNVDLCEKACNDDRRCMTYAYTKPGVTGPDAICWLKSSVPEPFPDVNTISGTSPWIDRVRPK
jgi:PAN domain